MVHTEQQEWLLQQLILGCHIRCDTPYGRRGVTVDPPMEPSSTVGRFIYAGGYYPPPLTTPRKHETWTTLWVVLHPEVRTAVEELLESAIHRLRFLPWHDGQVCLFADTRRQRTCQVGIVRDFFGDLAPFIEKKVRPFRGRRK